MTADMLTILIVVSLGLFTGTTAGLSIGYGAGKQKKDFQEMSGNGILTNLALVVICSALAIAGLAWYACR
jgi:hypothetical protein